MSTPECMFKKDTWVIHVRTNRRYFIVSGPDDYRRLEYCNQPFYEYRTEGGTSWVRRKDEMEDGRFKTAQS